MIRGLQIWHLLWLSLTPVLFALFRLTSEPHDADRALVDNLIVLGGAGWVACIAVYFVITGNKNEMLPNLLRLYRGLLNHVWFLWVANILGTLLVVFITYHLVFFRQVEFLSPIDVEIGQNNIAGQVQLLGYARAKTPTNFRLPLGKNLLLFKQTASNKVFYHLDIYVPSLLQDPRRVRQLIPYNKEIDHEKTE